MNDSGMENGVMENGVNGIEPHDQESDIEQGALYKVRSRGEC